jgi:hypothetical protein
VLRIVRECFAEVTLHRGDVAAFRRHAGEQVVSETGKRVAELERLERVRFGLRGTPLAQTGRRHVHVRGGMIP